MRNQGEPVAQEANATSGTASLGTASLAAQLAQATPDQQRVIIGEALYPLVEAQEAQAAAKVTGMLLEMDQAEVLHLVEDATALSAKVREALEVLRAAGQAPAE